MKTKPKNLKLYRHFYQYDDSAYIDTTKLVKKKIKSKPTKNRGITQISKKQFQHNKSATPQRRATTPLVRSARTATHEPTLKPLIHLR